MKQVNNAHLKAKNYDYLYFYIGNPWKGFWHTNVCIKNFRCTNIIRESREPRTDLPENLQCVVCLGAEREVRSLS